MIAQNTQVDYVFDKNEKEGLSYGIKNLLYGNAGFNLFAKS